MPVARRSSIARSASAARSRGKRSPTIGRYEPLLDQAVDGCADLEVDLGAAHHVATPSGADDLGVLKQQPVDLDLGDRPTGKPHHDQAAALAQRAQAVGEELSADRVEYDLHTATGERLRLILPRVVGAHHVVGARLQRDPLLGITRDNRDRARAQPLRDLQRGGAHAAGGAMDQHRLALAQPSAQDQREVGRVVVEDQACALREVELRGQRERQERGRHRGLGEPAERAESRHPVAGLHGRAGGRAANDTRDLTAGNEWQRRFDLILAAGLQQLGERDPGAVHVDQDAARPGLSMCVGSGSGRSTSESALSGPVSSVIWIAFIAGKSYSANGSSFRGALPMRGP